MNSTKRDILEMLENDALSLLAFSDPELLKSAAGRLEASMCMARAEMRYTQASEEITRLRKELEEAKAFIADTYGDEEKAAKYDWLVDNAGKWEVSKVGGTFTSLVDGKTYRPMVSFYAHGTAYLGCFFDDAVTLAMEKESENTNGI